MKNELCLPSLVFGLVLLLAYIESGSALHVYRNNEYEVSDIDKRIDIPHPGQSPHGHKHGLRRNRIIVVDETPNKQEQVILKRHHVAVPDGSPSGHHQHSNVLKRRVATHGLGNEGSVRGRDKIDNEDRSDAVHGEYYVADNQHQNVIDEENAEHEPEYEDSIKSLGRLVDKAEREIESTRSRVADVVDNYPLENEQHAYLRNNKENHEPSHHQKSHVGQKRQEIIHALNEENGRVEPEDDIESLGRRMDETGHEIKDAKYEQSPIADKHAAAATRYIISKIQEIQDKLFKRTGNKELENKLNLMAPGPMKKDKAVTYSNKTDTTVKTNTVSPIKTNTSMENKSDKKEKSTSSKPQPAERRKIIPEEVVDKILEKFQQLKKEAKHIAVSESRHSVEHAVEHSEGKEWKKDVTSSTEHSSSPSIRSYSHNHINAPNNVAITPRKYKKHNGLHVTRHVIPKNAKAESKLAPILVAPGKQLISKRGNVTSGKKRTISIFNDGRALLNLKSDIADYDMTPYVNNANNQQQDIPHDETFSSLQEGLNANPYADFSTRAGVAIPDLPPTLNVFNDHQKPMLQKNEDVNGEPAKHSPMKHDEMFNIESSTNENIQSATYNPGSDAFSNNQEKTFLGGIPDIASKYALPRQSEDRKPAISSMQVNGQLFETGVAFPGQVPILFKNNKYISDKEITIKRQRFPLLNISSNQRPARSLNMMTTPNNRNSFGISLPELLNLENEAQLFSGEVFHDVAPPVKTNLIPRVIEAPRYHGTPMYPLRNLNNINNPQRRVFSYAVPHLFDKSKVGIQLLNPVTRPQLESTNLPTSATNYQSPRMRSIIRHNNERNNDLSPSVKNGKLQQRSAVLAANMIANALQTELGINHPYILASNDPYRYVDKTLSQSIARQNIQMQQGNKYNVAFYPNLPNRNINIQNNNNIVPQQRFLNMKSELYSRNLGHNTGNNIVKQSDTLIPDRVMNYENNSGKTPAELLELINAKFASERLS